MAEGAPLGVWLAAVCALCPFLLASPWRHGFAFDDFRAVVRNADARWGAPLRDVLGDDFWGTPIRDQGSHKSYRPLATLSFQLDDALFGTAFPGGYKLHNLLWHVMVTLLAAAVLSAAGRRGSVRVVRMRRGTAVAAACLFAAHPVHCEAVMGVVGRAEVLMAALALGALLAARRRNVVFAVVLAIASALAKEQGVTILAACAAEEAFALYDGAVRGRTPRHAAVLRCAAYASAAVAFLTARLALGGAPPPWTRHENPAAFAPHILTRLLSYAHLHARSVGFVLNPLFATLCCDWGMGSVSLVESLSDARNVGTLAAYAALTLIVMLGLRRMPPEAARPNRAPRARTEPSTVEAEQDEAEVIGAARMALLVGVLPFMPSANLAFPVGFVLAERVLYLPSLGACALAAAMARRVLPRRRGVRRTALALAVLVMGARCSLRSAEWESAERIFAAGVRDNAGNQKLWAMLGDVILREGGAERLPEAEAAFERALALEPDDFKMHYSLARTSGLQGRHREAAERFARAASVGEIFAPHLTGPMYAAHCFNKAGEEARSAGDRFLAQELYRRGLELAEAADNAEERRIATNNIQALSEPLASGH